MTAFDAAERLLASRGAEEIEHPGGTLLAHLRRVRELLAAWGADPVVQVAGLCHAAYGTDGFGVALFSPAERSLVQEVIGRAAEEIVYFYCACDRKISYPQLSEVAPVFRDRFTGVEVVADGLRLQAFLAITAANEYDVFEHSEEFGRHREAFRRLLARVRQHLPPAACEAWELESAPVRRLRDAVVRIGSATLGRALNGTTHEDADDDVGTIDTDDAHGFDPFPLLEACRAHGAEVVVIGQVAGIMHGSQELTGDLDLLWDGENPGALAAAFQDVGAALTDDEGRPLPTSAESLAGAKVLFRSPEASGDCCTGRLPWGDLDIDQMIRRSEVADGIRFLRLDDLIAMRRVAGRIKDLRRVKELLGVGVPG